MNIKRILIIALLFTISSIYCENNSLNIVLKDWNIQKVIVDKDFDLGVIKKYAKTIRDTNFILSKNYENKILYLHIRRHIGYSKVYINDELLTELGTISQMKDKATDVINIIPIPTGNITTGEQNKIKIINYSIVNSKLPSINIKDTNNLNLNLTIYDKLKVSLPIAFTLILVFIFLSYLKIYNSDDEYKSNYYLISIILFIIYFISSGGNDGSIIKDLLIPIIPPSSISGWLCLMLYYAIKNNLWDIKKITFGTIVTTITILSTSILLRFGFIEVNDESIFRIILIIINISFLILILIKSTPHVKNIKIGLIVSLVLHISSFVLRVILKFPDYGMPQTAIIIVIISYYFTFFNFMSDKIDDNLLFNKKLLDSIDRIKQELLKKETQISELKSNNEEILREKSLFFTTLGRNLRAPLNSIIGYSENLYTSDNIEEVNPLVTEILIESDKIFQSINNIMDFSTRDFNNNDLQLKDFRMKEVFENSVYASNIISLYKKNINYIVSGDSDKVLIKGNPTIYKTMVTSVFEFLIGLNPETIDFNISNSGITESYMNLEVKFVAMNIPNNGLSSIVPLSNGKDVFTKYITLYNVYFKENFNENNYVIDMKFQCGRSDSNDKNMGKAMNIPTDYEFEKNYTVLVVEDYIPNLNIVKMHLTKMGCDVLTATDGEEAISIFKKEEIDLVLMDIKMPIMDGWEATEKIRSTEKGIDTMIVGLTASSLDLDIRHCFESGMDDVQVKPIKKNQLYNRVKSLESFNPETFPTIPSLRADFGLSSIETETLFVSTVNQISKQLEVMDMLFSAADTKGINKEFPVLLHAAMIINAFYFSRLLRNLEDAHIKRDKSRFTKIYKRLVITIDKVKEDNSALFRN